MRSGRSRAFAITAVKALKCVRFAPRAAGREYRFELPSHFQKAQRFRDTVLAERGGAHYRLTSRLTDSSDVWAQVWAVRVSNSKSAGKQDFFGLYGGESVSQSPLKDKAFSTFFDQNPPFELLSEMGFALDKSLFSR